MDTVEVFEDTDGWRWQRRAGDHVVVYGSLAGERSKAAAVSAAERHNGDAFIEVQASPEVYRLPAARRFDRAVLDGDDTPLRSWIRQVQLHNAADREVRVRIHDDQDGPGGVRVTIDPVPPRPALGPLDRAVTITRDAQERR